MSSFGLVTQQVAGLAAKLAADRLEGGEANRLGLAGLEDRQVGEVMSTFSASSVRVMRRW
jgi:hypothetical protein